MVPSGGRGKTFIKEITRLINLWDRRFTFGEHSFKSDT